MILGPKPNQVVVMPKPNQGVLLAKPSKVGLVPYYKKDKLSDVN